MTSAAFTVSVAFSIWRKCKLDRPLARHEPVAYGPVIDAEVAIVGTSDAPIHFSRADRAADTSAVAVEPKAIAI
jgi:hypothetical protein